MNNMHTNAKRQRIISALFLLLIAGFLLVSWIVSPTHTSFDVEEVYNLDTVWYNDSGTVKATSLPARFPYDENGTFTVCTTFPENYDGQVNSLCFRASQTAVRIWVDNELLLEQGHVRSATFFLGKSPGSSWVLVRLPEDYAGKELRIELTSPYKNYQGLLPSVYLGTRASLLYHIVHIHGPGLITALILIFLGVLLLLFYLLLWSRGISNRQILLLGIFGILAGIWMFGESQILQFFTGSLTSWFNLTIIALHLLPLPILFLAGGLPDFPYRHICTFIGNFLAAYVSLLILLQITGIRDFMEMLTLSMILLLILCIAVPALIFWDFLHNKNRKILSMTLAISVLSFFACAELIYDLIDVKTYVGSFIRTGILSFYLIISFSTVRNAMELFEEGLQTAYYKKLSYTDQMTKCKNQRAFLERENAWTPGKGDAMVMIDLNNLKKVNDTLGHPTGDHYLMTCADAVREVFRSKGECYRLGGDEFLFWGTGISEQELAALEKQFVELAHKKCRDISPLCSVATGIAVYSPEDATISDTRMRADKNMYVAKWLMKEAAYFAELKKAESEKSE